MKDASKRREKGFRSRQGQRIGALARVSYSNACWQTRLTGKQGSPWAVHYHLGRVVCVHDCLHLHGCEGTALEIDQEIETHITPGNVSDLAADTDDPQGRQRLEYLPFLQKGSSRHFAEPRVGPYQAASWSIFWFQVAHQLRVKGEGSHPPLCNVGHPT